MTLNEVRKINGLFYYGTKKAKSILFYIFQCWYKKEQHSVCTMKRSGHIKDYVAVQQNPEEEKGHHVS